MDATTGRSASTGKLRRLLAGGIVALVSVTLVGVAPVSADDEISPEQQGDPRDDPSKSQDSGGGGADDKAKEEARRKAEEAKRKAAEEAGRKAASQVQKSIFQRLLDAVKNAGSKPKPSAPTQPGPGGSIISPNEFGGQYLKNQEADYPGGGGGGGGGIPKDDLLRPHLT